MKQVIFALLILLTQLGAVRGETNGVRITDVAFTAACDGTEQRYVLLLPAGFKPGQTSAKETSPQRASLTKAFTINALCKNDWSVNTNAPGVTATYPASGGMVLKSVSDQPAAVAELAEHTIGRNGTIILKVNLAGRFVVRVGPVALEIALNARRKKSIVLTYLPTTIYSRKACRPHLFCASSNARCDLKLLA
jgi:hypothetical protein